MEALFTSLDGGNALRERLFALVNQASALAATKMVELHVMIFSFTDRELADQLLQAAERSPALTIRIIADWSQRIHARGQQVGRLARSERPNLLVRYTKDQPYIWDPAVSHMRWSYRASRGLLHHKTLSMIVDGQPWQLICGSFNWTANAAQSYENLLIVTPVDPDSHALMTRLELEFAALWGDARITLSPRQTHLHYQTILHEYRADPTLAPTAIAGLLFDAEDLDAAALRPSPHGAPAQTPAKFNGCEPPVEPCGRTVAIAFNARTAEQTGGVCGYAPGNRDRRYQPARLVAKARKIPLTITNLALDVILAAAPGETLLIAMYGLSARVPEFGALLDAARRGVKLRFLLDGSVGAEIAERITQFREASGLAIEIRTVSRMMHQKYIVNPAAKTVLTGTANLTRDASSRHFEHRILIARDEQLVNQFTADFETIWARLSSAQNRAKEGQMTNQT